MIDAVAGRQRLRRVAWRMPRARVLIALLAAVVLIGGGWLWLRDSSLVAVKRVTIVGATGADASQVRSALVLAARDMTTLDVHVDQLKSAVAQFPAIKDLRVSTQFPHGMQIQVIEQIPVGVVVVDGRRIAVAGDGTLLHDVIPAPSLPSSPCGYLQAAHA
jgi:cell division protein FtsQ